MRGGGSVAKRTLASLTPQTNAVIIATLGKAAVQEKKQITGLIAVQLIFACAVTATVLAFGATPEFSIAVWCGGGVSALNSVMLAWRTSRANKHDSLEATLELRLLYFYAMERFLSIVVMLGLVMAATRQPPAVLVGFVSGQAIMLLTRLFLQFRK